MNFLIDFQSYCSGPGSLSGTSVIIGLRTPDPLFWITDPWIRINKKYPSPFYFIKDSKKFVITWLSGSGVRIYK